MTREMADSGDAARVPQDYGHTHAIGLGRKGCDTGGLGPRGLPPLCEGHGVGGPPRPRRGVRHRPRPAAGSGNVAIRAAEAGARVVAADLTPAGFEAGRREAHACGVELEWVEADAAALPFEDGAFDAVTSCFGAMFVPDHERVAAEITRVCRPGGTIGLASFTPESLAPAFFGVFAPYMPPSPGGSLPPVLWGREEHVRELLADRVSSLRLERRVYVERAADPAAYCALCKETFGPIVTVYESLRDDPDAWTSRRARAPGSPVGPPSIHTSTSSPWRAPPCRSTSAVGARSG